MEVRCEEERPAVKIVWPSGASIGPSEALVVATTDFFAGRASVRSGAPPKTEWAFAPLVRDAAANWVTARGGRLGAADLLSPSRWEMRDGGACLGG